MVLIKLPKPGGFLTLAVVVFFFRSTVLLLSNSTNEFDKKSDADCANDHWQPEVGEYREA